MNIDIFGTSLNFDMLSRRQVILCFDVTGDTIDNWIELGMPVNIDDTFSISKCFKWRLDREANKIRVKEILPTGEIDIDEARRLDVIESARKKKIENDLNEGLLVNKGDADKLFYNLGVSFKSAMLNFIPSVSPILVGKSQFEIETIIRKQVERSLNEFADEEK